MVWVSGVVFGSYDCSITGFVLQFVLSSVFFNADELLIQNAEMQALVQSVMGHGQWPSDAGHDAGSPVLIKRIL
jgi:hypothetical protein